MTTYSVKLIGMTAMLQHHDNIAWADEMKEWGLQPANKAVSVAGDDRSPPFRWVGSMYGDGQRVVLPGDNIMSTLKAAGAMVPTGRGRETFKAITQSGLIVAEASWPLLVNGKEIPTAPFWERKESRTFPEYQKLAAGYGFSLLVKRAPVSGTSKHIRVRAQFDGWTAAGTVMTLDERISEESLRTILATAGRFKGVGDWRPGAPKSPGPWGMFKAEVERIEA